MFFIDTASPLTGNSLYVDGDLQLIQRWPMQDKVDYMFTNPAINFTQAVGNDYAALTWPRIVSDYLDKDGSFNSISIQCCTKPRHHITLLSMYIVFL